MLKKPAYDDQPHTESVAIESSADFHRIAHHSQTSTIHPARLLVNLAYLIIISV